MIRKAETKDIPRILELYIDGLKDIGISDIDESKCKAKVAACFYLAPCFLLVINDKICGIAGLTINTLPWSGAATLCDYMFYVEPEHRDLSNLGGLVNACKDFADKNGFPLRVDFIVNNDEKLKKRLLKMYGFKVSSVVGTYNG